MRNAHQQIQQRFFKTHRPNFCLTMLTEEAFCPHDSPSGLKHNSNYDLTLVVALMYAKRVNFVKYSKVLEQYTSVVELFAYGLPYTDSTPQHVAGIRAEHCCMHCVSC